MSTLKHAPRDLVFRNCGTVWRFIPLTQRASEWIEENVHIEGWQWSGPSFAVDWRFVGPLLDGARAAGLEVGV
jgi:hypothetical protein